MVVKRVINGTKALDSFSIPVGVFRSQFIKLNRDLLLHVDPTDKLTTYNLTEEDITRYLTMWLQIIAGKPGNGGKEYVFKVALVEELARRRDLPLAARDIYDGEAFDKFVKTFVA